MRFQSVLGKGYFPAVQQATSPCFASVAGTSLASWRNPWQTIIIYPRLVCRYPNRLPSTRRNVHPRILQLNPASFLIPLRPLHPPGNLDSRSPPRPATAPLIQLTLPRQDEQAPEGWSPLTNILTTPIILRVIPQSLLHLRRCCSHPTR